MKFGPLVGSLDEGTSSARFLIFKAGTAEVVCQHQMNVPQIYPREGWVEQDPELIYSIVEECIKEATKKLEKKGGKLEDIKAVGITNQRESTIVWDRNTGKPLYNAIIWMDNRTTGLVDELVKGLPPNCRSINFLRALTGLPLSPYFSALKLRWLRDNVPRVREAFRLGTAMFGTVDSWLIYKLTGGKDSGSVHVTDVTNASRTMLMNIQTLNWDSNLLTFFGLPPTILPRIYSSAEVYGYINIPNLKFKAPIAACIGDQQAALIGQQCFRPGMTKATYGTGCFLLTNIGEHVVHSKSGLLCTVAYKLGESSPVVYALEGSVAVAGAAFSWLRDNLNLIENLDEIEEMARKVEDSLDVYFVPAFSGLYAPHWNQEARGILCGLTENTTSEHIVRATLEAVCFQIRDILDAIVKDGDQPLTALAVDGGMTKNSLLMQLQADLTGIEVLRPKNVETTALGAALAAWKTITEDFNIEEPVTKRNDMVIYKPAINEKQRDMRYKRWKMAIEKSLNWEIN